MLIGVLGAGQLGRMLALAGYPLGLRFRFLDTVPGAPAGALAEQLVGDFADPAVLAQFAHGLDLATYEFENVPAATVEWLAARCPVYPPIGALATAQDRLNEKNLFQRLAIPTTPFVPIDSRDELTAALAHTGLPAVLKTRHLGYDGKGQAVLRVRADIAPAWDALGGVPLLLEGFVPFVREFSLLAVRNRSGTTVFYPLVENVHHSGMLRRSLVPSPGLSAMHQAQAEAYAVRVLDALGYVGVLAIEFFQKGDDLGSVLANELAPRVHNSGHWTIEGAETSQFENHLRAIVGWPLGSTRTIGHSALTNLIGKLPDPAAVLGVPGAHLHLYGKEPRPRRKLGHITLQAPSAAELHKRLAALPFKDDAL